MIYRPASEIDKVMSLPDSAMVVARAAVDRNIMNNTDRIMLADVRNDLRGCGNPALRSPYVIHLPQTKLRSAQANDVSLAKTRSIFPRFIFYTLPNPIETTISVKCPEIA